MPCTATTVAVELTEEIAAVAISTAAVEFPEIVVVTAAAAVEDKDWAGVVVTVVVGMVELVSDTDDVIIADVVAVVSVEAIVVEISVETADDVDDNDTEEDEDVIELSGNRPDHVNNKSGKILQFNRPVDSLYLCISYKGTPR